ncbi:FIG062788: hypothetical protein [plant metagenome]|uniref:Uncharacterized protein n=1 Tax=plant metagenome TaxID=1297885 RepID=A0A484NUE3_9ZZZZ
MNAPELYALRERFNSDRTLLCFNGPISRSLIEEIGKALKNYLEQEQAQPRAATDVFAVYIEMTQNIRHYAVTRGFSELDSAATVVIARDDLGRYVVSAGNSVEPEDGQALLKAVESLSGLDKNELKALYKEQLRKPRDQEAATGAGLGLIDIARKSSAPLSATLSHTTGQRAFFSLSVVI